MDHVHNHFGDQCGTVTMLAARLAGIDYSITFHGPHIFFDPKYSSIREKVLGARFIRAGLCIEKYDYRPPRELVKRLFCAARLSPEKGLPFLIHALKLLLDDGHELELRVAGDGPSRGQLETLAMELGLSNHVYFLGYLGEDAIIRELQAADLFVLPSFAEGIPVSAMEAMAVGVPVIATNTGGISELIEDGKTGLLVRPSDSEALAGAVVAMIEDYYFRRRAAELARKKVTDEFDIEKEMTKFNAYLLESCA
jgi:colanic acid/amylovoran biosynthesis glycosyltransferase